MTQTSVEWFLQELEKVHYHPTEAMIMYANKLCKQEQDNISAQRYIDGYNKAKETLYTEDQVREVIGKARLLDHNDNEMFGEDYLIKSITQPKK
jgi:hypothetical protein